MTLITDARFRAAQPNASDIWICRFDGLDRVLGRHRSTSRTARGAIDCGSERTTVLLLSEEVFRPSATRRSGESRGSGPDPATRPVGDYCRFDPGLPLQETSPRWGRADHGQQTLVGADAGSRRDDNSPPIPEAPMDTAPAAVQAAPAASFASYPFLVESYRRSLRSENESPRTIESYAEAPMRFSAFLAAQGRPLDVHRSAKTNVVGETRPDESLSSAGGNRRYRPS